MRRISAMLTLVAALSGPALAQMPETPGPGGIPIAPGAPVRGYTPGGIGPGGTPVAPGPAARDVPMYRTGPGGIGLPPRPDPYPQDHRAVAKPAPACRHGACGTAILPQTLTVTITSREENERPPPAGETIGSIDELFAALHSCWNPPPPAQSRQGLQMTVRFSFRRSGELMGLPFVTYTSPGTGAATKQAYRRAIASSLEQCTFRFSKSFGAAIAGRPISVRYVDDRKADAGPPRP